MTAYHIARRTTASAARLQDIERAAAARFHKVGMNDIADADATPVSILQDRAVAGRLYVAHAADDAIVGFLIWSPKDGFAYIEEVSVHPDHAGHRLAARLIEALADDVCGDMPALTLTTFRDVPWNAPYYAKLGFVELPRHCIGPDHAESWRHQAANGLDMTRRLFMTMPVKASSSERTA